MDLSHVFERGERRRHASPAISYPPRTASTALTFLPFPSDEDVEFNSTHVISAQEAVDVAIAPVLDEAALALSSASDHQTRDLVREAQGGDDVSTTSGWSSPAGASPVSHPGATQRYANASRSPTRGGAGGAGGSRSFSPSSDGGARATSPGSSTSFSIGTPPDETLHPFSQHLSDALEKTEAARVAGVEGEEQQEHLFSNPSSHPGSHANAAEVVIPAPILAPAPRVATINSSSSHLTMPTPFPIDTSASPAGSIPASPSIEAGAGAGAAKARRLSFLSYAGESNSLAPPSQS